MHSVVSAEGHYGGFIAGNQQEAGSPMRAFRLRTRLMQQPEYHSEVARILLHRAWVPCSLGPQILKSQVSFGLGIVGDRGGVACSRLNFQILLGSDGNALAFSDSAQIAGGRRQDNKAGRSFPHSGGSPTGQAKAQTKAYQESQS